jgi:tetratricopeptide (TPR) repeat protein
MPALISEEINRGRKLFSEGKIEEALLLFRNLAKNGELTSEEKLRLQINEGTCLGYLGRKFKTEMHKIAIKAFQESKKLKNPFILARTLMLKYSVYFSYDRTLDIWGDIKYAENFLKSSSYKPSEEIEQAKSLLNFIKSWFYWGWGELDRALEFLEECLEITKRYKSHDPIKGYIKYRKFFRDIYRMFGHLYSAKGELELALDFFKKSLEYFDVPINIEERLPRVDVLIGISAVYYQHGNPDLAVKHYKESLEISEHINHRLMKVLTGYAFEGLIRIFIDTNSIELVKEYFQHYSQYEKKHGNLPNLRNRYKLSEARILKSSSRTRDRAEAEKILKQILAEQQWGGPEQYFDINLSIFPIIELCGLYLEELKSTRNLEILDDCQPLVEKLVKITRQWKTYSCQAQINLLQGQIALLQLNMGDARRYLTKAQKIAGDHGLQLLAREISHEHDLLMEKLEKLESVDKSKVAFSERMGLVSLEDTIDLMLQKRGIKPPRLIDEAPVLLLIIAEGGIPAFSNSFVEDWTLADDIISSFLTAFNSFSEEVFSKGLDRAKFGEYLLVMDSIGPFSVCYLFKGQSYLAKQKLIHFAHRVQNTASIWGALKNFLKTNQVIEVSENPPLESLITEIFIKKNLEISTQI